MSRRSKSNDQIAPLIHQRLDGVVGTMLVPFIRYDAQQARCIVRVGILKAMKIHGFVYCRNNGKACASSTQAIVPSPDRGMFRAAYRLSGPLVCGPYLREAYPIGVVL